MLIALCSMSVLGQVKTVRGTVTYVAAGTVYTSIGKEQGAQDSTTMMVLSGTDTMAVLCVYAASSKSTACKMITSKREIRIGDSLTAFIPLPQPKHEPPSPMVVRDSASVMQSNRDTAQRRIRVTDESQSWIRLQGRIGVQYIGIRYETSAFNMQQPGMVFSVRGNAVDMPLRFDFYGTTRSLSRGRTGLLTAGSTNDTRVYRLAVEYDDGSTILSLGRIIPPFASSIGSIDGASASQRFGDVLVGMSAGFQPGYALRGLSTDQRKLVLFANYQSHDPWNTSVSSAYARTVSDAGVEREAVSASVSSFSASGMSVYASSDVDLRSPSNNRNPFKPSLSLLLCAVNYRFTDYLTIGVGVDASRPIYSMSTAQLVPDTLLDRRLRSGLTLSLNVSVGSGAGIYNTFTPRASDAGFGKEYMNSTMFYMTNVLGSGTSARMNLTLNESALTLARGAGIAVQRNVVGIDLGIRYQRSQYTVRQLGSSSASESFGLDAAGLITNHLMMVGSYDVLSGVGERSNTLFVELSWRF